jgi:hypothetical protein
MEAQITTRYRAKYAVTIMGKGYAPGDEIIDPGIDGKVLRRLADNGRVILVPHVHVPASKLAGEFDDDDDGDDGDDDGEPEGDAPATPVAPAEGGEPADVEGVAVAAVKAAAQPVTVKVTIPAATNLNAAWKAAFAKHRENGETLKGYLQRVLQEHQIKASGPVQELVNRLASAGVQPGVAGH